MLPIDVRLGKMLVLGSVFRCLDPLLTVAACLSAKPLFTAPPDRRAELTRYGAPLQLRVGR
jgi:HrpA-like RNA helicase